MRSMVEGASAGAGARILETIATASQKPDGGAQIVPSQGAKPPIGRSGPQRTSSINLNR